MKKCSDIAKIKTMEHNGRAQKIIEFINLNQGCNATYSCEQLKSQMAPNTFFKELSKLKKLGIIEEKHVNRKEHKLFVNKNNPLLYIRDRLNEFDRSFKELSNKISERVDFLIVKEALRQEIQGISSSTDCDFEMFPHSEIRELQYKLLSLFYRMIDSCLLQSVQIWPKVIHDKDTLRMLYETTFRKISKMLLELTEQHNDAKLLTSSLQMQILKRIGGASDLLDYQKVYEKVGMKREIESVIDSLWNIDKDIRNLIYREPETYGFKLNKSDDWRKLLQVCKYYVEQNLDKE